MFRAKAFSQITVGANDAQMGSATLSVNGGAAAETAIAYENDTVTLTAAPGERYMLTGWKVEDIDGTAIDITASELTATFTELICRENGFTVAADEFDAEMQKRLYPPRCMARTARL